MTYSIILCNVPFLVCGGVPSLAAWAHGKPSLRSSPTRHLARARLNLILSYIFNISLLSGPHQPCSCVQQGDICQIWCREEVSAKLQSLFKLNRESKRERGGGVVGKRTTSLVSRSSTDITTSSVRKPLERYCHQNYCPFVSCKITQRPGRNFQSDCVVCVVQAVY